MGSFSPIHWIIVIVVIVLLFGGRGRISGIMGDFGRGIRSFKDGLADANKPDVKAQIENDKDKADPV